MKKTLSLMLAFFLCLSLCACGKSEAVKNVETLIKAIGEVSAESGEAITDAEAAYNALTDEEKEQVSGIGTLSAAKVDYAEALIASIGEVTLDSEPAILAAEEAYNILSDAEKEVVDNYTVLIDAKNTFDYIQFRASLVGEWVTLSDNSTTVFSLNDDGTATIEDYKFTWELAPDKNVVKLDGFVALNLEVSHIFEFVTLGNPELFDMVIKKDTTEQLVEKYFTVVELNAENYSEYIGESICLGNVKNEWGEDGDSVFCFRSTAVENGLIFVAANSDFIMEIGFYSEASGGACTFNTGQHPYAPFALWYDNPTSVSIARIKGSMMFISSEYVANVCYSENSSSRIITLTDGSTIVDRCTLYSWNNDAFYKWAADANIQF